MMSSKLSKNSKVNSILVVSQTNIGDVVLGLPVIDILCRDFPQVEIDVMIGPKAASLFAGNPRVGLNIFDKRAPLGKRILWFWDLRKKHYDCVIDLRRTALAFFLAPRYATPLFQPIPARMLKKEALLGLLRQVYDFGTPSEDKYAVQNTKEDELFFEGAVAPALQNQRFVVIAPGAASSNKRWDPQGFAQVADWLSAKCKVVFVGDNADAEIVSDIQGRMKSASLSLAGKIDLRQLSFILKKCDWAMVHDSGVMHLACYFNVPVLVLWGPTNIERYGPWSPKSMVIRRNENCLRCKDPQSKVEHNCMSFIKPEDVIKQIGEFIRVP